MRRINLITLLTMFNLIFLQTISAEIKLPAIVSSNMILQRNTTVVIWGWANPNESITISTSWLEKSITVTSDKNGDWKMEVKTSNIKLPQIINLKSKDSNITLNNILFGEVWLCSGQSNMQMPVKGNKGQPTFGSTEAIIEAKNSNIRLFTVKPLGSLTPLKDVKEFIFWQEATPESVANFSAVAYFFGNQLHKFLDVPVGIIHASWGSSIVESWMSKNVLSKHQKINFDNAKTQRFNKVQTALFNAMINPIIPYTIKGSLWYQGESNILNYNEYKTLFPAMVKDWRNRWGIGNFPFFYVQIAPFQYGDSKSVYMREAQLQCLDLIPNSGIAITLDVGDKRCIHPPKKKEVADRLLFNVLNQTYGYKSIQYMGPIYLSQEVKKEGLMLTFKNEKSGIYAYNELKGFEIAGGDKVFHPAIAKVVNREKVFVKSDKVKNPVAVRYAWKSWVIGTLYSSSMLPASSFRTDNWNGTQETDK